MNRILACFLVFLTVPVFAQEFTLCENGSTNYTLVVGENPAPVTLNAANELRETLREITDVEFPTGVTGAKCIFVGESEGAKKAFPDVDFTSFKPDEIVIRTDAAGNLLLAGSPQRGTLYAVVTFLEDTLGCRWWTETASFIPKCPTLRIGALDVRYAPRLIYREAYYRQAFREKFAVHSKCNGGSEGISPEWGGHYQFLYGVHSFFKIIPPAKYFQAHPEWFAELEGVRKDDGQLCLTNEEMRREFIANVLADLRANPGCHFVSISQNDCHGFCTCPKCRAVDEANESPSGTLITFVNQVAEAVEKEFPDVWVETLAYQYARKPPKLVKPRKNVLIRLCTIECSFLQPLETGELNRTLKDDIEGWSRIAPQLFVWDYVTNFSQYLLPHPNMRVLPENIRFFVKNKTIGLFEQGDSFTTVGDFVEPRTWVISHLMWNPNADADALWKEFFDGYYGPAGPYLQEYLDIIHDAAEKTGYNLRCYQSNTSGWLDYETLRRADAVVKRAREAAAGDETLALRVNRALVAYDMNVLLRYNGLLLTSKLRQEPFWGPENPRAAARALLNFCESQGNRAYRESWSESGWEEYKADLLNRFPESPAQAARNPELNLDWANTPWLDVQDAQMSIYGPVKKFGEKVDDPAASDGRAVRMSGDHFEWATSFSFPREINAEVSRWHVYAVVRWDAAAADGQAMTLGIYDWQARRSVAHKSLNIQNFEGNQYHTIDLGTHDLTGTMYLWFAPPKRPGEVQAVFVDRAFFIPER